MHTHNDSGLIGGEIHFENLFQFLVEIFKHAMIITAFVLIMMLLLEYLTILSRGRWNRSFDRNPWMQVLFSAILGFTPGCLGVYVAVSMYAHRIINFAALVSAMIATAGDETFVMMAVIPDKTLLILTLLFVIALITGWGLNLTRTGRSKITLPENHLKFHDHDPDCRCFAGSEILSQLRRPGLERSVLLFAGILFIIFLISGDIGPENWGWQRIIFLVVAAIEVFIVATVPDHFLEKHLWEHVVRKHAVRVFLWTFGAFLLIHVGLEFFLVEKWITDNLVAVMIIALLVGIIPESGPHIVFITLFAGGAIPLSVLLANSVVQDGHGALPLLAESRRDFIRMKVLKLSAGILVGSAGLLLGF